MTLDGPVDWRAAGRRRCSTASSTATPCSTRSSSRRRTRWACRTGRTTRTSRSTTTCTTRPCPSPGDEAALQAFVERKMQEPIDRSRPLWHFYVIDGYQGGSVVVSRFHHALADGIALAEVLLSLTDARAGRRPAPRRRRTTPRPADEPEPPPTSLLEVAGRFARPVTAPVSAGLRGALHVLGEIPAALHPSYAVEALTTAWQTGQIADKLLLGHNPESPFSGAARPRQARGLVAAAAAGRHQAGRPRRRRHGQRRARGRGLRRDQPLRRRPRGRPRGPVDDGARSTCAAPASRSPASSATSSRW